MNYNFEKNPWGVFSEKWTFFGKKLFSEKIPNFGKKQFPKKYHFLEKLFSEKTQFF